MTSELVIDESTGEILDLPEGIDETGILALLAARRDDAHRQEKAWERQRIQLDAAILARLEPGARAVYGDVRLSVRSRRGAPVTNAQKFSAELLVREASKLALIEVIGAAKGFDRDKLPPDEDVIATYDECTSEGQGSRPWVETSVVLRRLSE